MQGLREWLRGEVDVMVGFANFVVRTTSLRFPKSARTVKRLLGMPLETSAGATLWAEAIPARSAANCVSGDAA